MKGRKIVVLGPPPIVDGASCDDLHFTFDRDIENWQITKLEDENEEKFPPEESWNYYEMLDAHFDLELNLSIWENVFEAVFSFTYKGEGKLVVTSVKWTLGGEEQQEAEWYYK